MEEIRKEELLDEDNHVTCECGNKTIHQYSWTNDYAQVSCPQCMVSWQDDQIKALKKLIYKISSKNKEETVSEITNAYAEMMGIEPDELPSYVVKMILEI